MFGYFIGTKTDPGHRQLKPASIPPNLGIRAVKKEQYSGI